MAEGNFLPWECTIALYDGNVFLKVRADVLGIRPDGRTHLQAGRLESREGD